MRFLILAALTCTFACRSDQHHQIPETPAKPLPIAIDTTKAALPNGSAKIDWTKYKIHTRKTMGAYKISLWQNDSDLFSRPLLLVNDSLTHKKDTLSLSHITSLQDRQADIVDITKSVGFDQLTLSLSWEGENDNIYSEIIGYQQDTLKELFKIPTIGGLVDLKRKDKQALAGHIYYLDDIVYMPHDNYVITVSLPDYDINVYTPDTVSVDYDTKATDTIHAFRLSASGKQIPHIILPGTQIHVDTIYSLQQIVSLHLSDSTRLTVPHDEISGKVKGNDAG